MSSDSPHAPFPSDETLAAFVDGRLDRETRQRVVEHVAGCDDCRDVVIFSDRFAHSQRGSEVRAFPKRRAIVLAVAAAIVAVIALGVIRFVVAHRENAGIVALADAAPPYRAFEGRVSAMPYRPLRPTYRGEESSDDSGSWRALAVAGNIRKDVAAQPTTANLHALGVADLTLGDARGAVAELERAIATNGDAATHDDELLNDLSAAYLASGDATSSLRYAERAWTVRRSPPAAWNRAVAATKLGMTDRAAAAWKDYLSIDSGSPWAAEARTRLRALSSAVP